MVWNKFPTQINQSADQVLGQTDFMRSNSPHPPTAASLSQPTGTGSGVLNKVYVPDSGNNRVLVYNYNAMGTAITATAALVLGQANFTTATVNGGAGLMNVTPTGFNFPSGAVATKDKLVVTDQVNSRVLIWGANDRAAAAAPAVAQPRAAAVASGPPNQMHAQSRHLA